MSVREKIFKDLNKIQNKNKLNEIYDFIQQINNSNDVIEQENRTAVMQLRGCLSNEDAQEMKAIVNNEFSHVEGDLF